MTANLSENGYEQTKRKLVNLQRRLAAIETQANTIPKRRAAVIRSYRETMQQYLREIKLYEAKHTAAARAKKKANQP